jgi:ABC-2 type transport system ATP-binding protein
MSALAIETHGLRKWFGTKRAVADLSLSVRRGEVFGFLGPNGAGKTTSLKMLLGLVEPSGGGGRVLGAPLGDRAARARVGFLPEHFRFQDWLTGREMLHFHGALFGLSGPALDARVETLLVRVDLVDAAKRKLREYSKGMGQRLGLAAALLAKPELVFLDEPTSGLDPLGRLMVRDVIRELRSEGVAVFLNSHLLGEVEATCDRVAFVKQGRVVHDLVLGDTAAGLVARLCAGPLDAAALGDLARFGTDVRREGDEVRLRIAHEGVLPEIARWAVARGAPLSHLSAARDTLENVFVRVMDGERAG